ADNLEHDARQAKEQLAELTRTAADYSQMIERKEADILRVKADLDASKAERSHLSKEVIDLKVQIETLSAELSSRRESESRNAALHVKLQDELDELRALMEAKTSEESRRSEVERKKDEELLDLRSLVPRLREELAAAQLAAVDVQSKLTAELKSTASEH
ncbi:hypothetical protein FA95DRAFT_1454172, partial [Auriscalpium vulgare]